MATKKIPKRIQRTIAEAKEQLTAIYAQHLKEIILFGSYARGDFSSGSDIDLLLLLDQMTSFAEERKRYLPIVCELSLKYDTVLSVVPMSYDTYCTKGTPLIMNARREGVHL